MFHLQIHVPNFSSINIRSGNMGQQGLMILVGQSASVPQSPISSFYVFIYLLARLLVCQLKWAEWEHDGLYLDF